MLAFGKGYNMTVKTEVTEYSLYNDLWSGGLDTITELTVNEVAEILTALDDGSEWTLAELNDFFWFERDRIAEWLGYNDFDEIMTRNRD